MRTRASDSVRATAQHVFSLRSKPWKLLVPGGVIGTTAASGMLFASSLGTGVRVIGGGLFLVAALTMQYLTSWAVSAQHDAEGTEADRLRVAMKDALQPLAESIAGMTILTPAKQRAARPEVADQAVGTLLLLLKDVYRLRAVIYGIAPDGRSLERISYHGRGGPPPHPFEQGTARGDSVFELLSSGKGSFFVQDLDRERPPGYAGSGVGYKTFISAPITNGDSAYGMVSVDAPNAGDLVDTDAQIVMLVADLLSIAFAMSD